MTAQCAPRAALALLVGPVAALALSLTACGGPETADAAVVAPGEVPQSPGSRVEVVVLEQTSAKLDLRLPGEVVGSRDASLATQAGGYVESVHVRRGESVREGDVIARVNSSMYYAQLQQAEAQFALASSELERVEKLGDLASAAQVQAARTQVEVARANVRLARINSSRATVRAPFDGTVTQIDLEKGEVLSPSVPVARVVQLDPVHVSISVSDRDVGVLQQGMPVEVTVDAVAGVFKGNVVSIDRAASLDTRTFIAEVAVDNADGRLLPGMIANVSLSAELGDGAVVLPQDWLVTRMENVGVFLDRDGAAEWRTVDVGTVVHDQVLVNNGLAAGDRVIMVGHRSLADGDPLIISREGACCEDGRAVF